MKGFGKYIMTALKGAGMGAADVVPGVSGGTIAFMTGIYDELLGSISSINVKAFKLLFSGKFREFWKHINGGFLLSLVCGIGLSVLTIARLMTYLLENHPIQTWAFFFGLIVASSIFILRGISGWKAGDVINCGLGILLGVLVCTLSPTTTPDALWFIFLSGAIAICAMILPGISGSFILLILGKYEYIMGTINNITSGVNIGQNILILGVFLCGAAIGIISFSKFLHWLMGKYHRQTLLILAGFIIGSLVKVWPWSNKVAIIESQFPALRTLEGGIDEQVIEMFSFQVNNHIPGAILFALVGFFLVTGIELLSKKIGSKTDKE